MACNCIKEQTEKIIGYIKEQRPGQQISDTGFDHETLPFTTAKGLSGSVILLPFTYKFSFQKKDGSMSQPRKAVVNMAPVFCPFCGVQIKDDEPAKS